MDTICYAAFYGEYEQPYPIGIFRSLDEAKKAVEYSEPSYNAQVASYNLTTGESVDWWHCTPRTQKEEQFRWRKEERV